MRNKKIRINSLIRYNCLKVLFCVFCLSGCFREENLINVLVRTQNDKMIYVDHISGFSSSPAGGFFMDGKEGSSLIDDKKNPVRCTIYWNFTEDKKPDILIETTVEFKPLIGKEYHDYVLIFNKDGMWEAYKK